MIILENTKEYKDTKLAIPVGIGVVQTESVKNFYNTSDADATSVDILIDKTAYGKYGKLTGTLNLGAEKEISYQDGYETGKTDGYDSGYSIGYEGGYNAGNSEGYQDGYAEGLDDGITDGRNQIIEEQSDANITANDVTKGKIGYGANNEKIVGTSEAITSIDVATSGIKFGYSSFTKIPSYFDFSNVTNMDYMFANSKTQEFTLNTHNVVSMIGIFQYCNLKNAPNLDTSKVTTMEKMFGWNYSLESIPLYDTSNVKSFYYFCESCTKLTSVPALNTSNATTMNDMFYNCSSLETLPEFNGGKCSNFNYFCTGNNLVNFGGIVDMGKSSSITLTRFLTSPKLSYESCMNVINKLYDRASAGYSMATLSFNATPYALLSADDIAIATAKGWIVQAG